MASCLSCDTCVPWFCPHCREERCSWFEDPCRECGATRAEWHALSPAEKWTLQGYTAEQQAELVARYEEFVRWREARKAAREAGR